MAARPAHLPDYNQPPLNEVALGIQFSEIKGLGAIHAGLFWQTIRDRFPKWSEQPPLPVTFEVFGGAQPRAVAPMVEMFTTAPMNRFWFIEQHDIELIQLQRDRFHHNWRNIGESDRGRKYPHYEAIRQSFSDGLTKLTQFLAAQELPPIEPNQCEVTYVNHFDAPEEEGFARAMMRLFGHWYKLGPELGANLEQGSIDLKFKLQLPNTTGPVGRLHVSVNPAFRRDGRPIVVMQLLARGRPLTPDVNGCLGFMDFAREAIVLRFTQLTSDEMHKQWGRFQ